MGPTLSFRGLDNASYYRLAPDNRRHCINDTGCGNTLNLAHPRVLQMVMDSLRYWVHARSMSMASASISAPCSGARRTVSIPGAGFFDALRQDPVLSHVKLIAEPWDIGPGGYNWARHPPGWPSGTTGSATACAGSGAAIPDSAPIRRSPCRLGAICSARDGRRPWAASTSPPATTDSP